MPHEKMTRRALGVLAAVSMTPPAGGDDSPPAVRELQLPPELRATLDQPIRRAIEEARWLEELPLDEVAPGFTFRAD